MMSISIGAHGASLIFAGVLLFVIGLFQGLLIPKFKNSRMGLSAHLTAVQAGTAIVVFGVIWSLVTLSPLLQMIAQLGFIGGNYFIWFGITLSAITGASKALPIAGKGFHGSRISEITVTTVECIGIALSLFSSLLILFGLGLTVFETMR